MTSVLVVEHEPGCPPERLAGWLADAGLAVEVVRPYAGEPLPGRVHGPGGLVVLGGTMGALDDDVAPWLPAVRRLLVAAVDDAVPTLGVCLGAQLLAVACGGRVEVGAAGPEAGVAEVHWRPEAAGDPVVGGLPEPYAGPSMHHDAVTVLPPGAVWLGETAAYPHQVFRVGPCAWGVQFHPEVTLPTLERWVAHDAADLARWGIDATAVLAELTRRDPDAEAHGAALAGAFAGVVHAVARGTVLERA